MPTPRLSQEHATTTVATRLPDDMADHLAVAAKARGVRRSVVIREAVAAWLEQNAQEQHTAA